MEKAPFQPLVMLERKPLLGRRTEVKVKFFEKQVGPITITQEEVTETTQDYPEPPPVQLGQVTKIVDKRKKSMVDRSQILNRLRGAFVVRAAEDLSKEAKEELLKAQSLVPSPEAAKQVPVPVKTTQRIVIKTRPPSSKPVEKTETLPVIQSVVTEKTEDEALEELNDLLKRAEEDIPEKGVLETQPDTEPVVIIEEQSGKPKRGRKPKGAKPGTEDVVPMEDIDMTTAVINSQLVKERLPKEREHVILKAPTYYMNNRKLFVQKLTELFKPYQHDLLETDESVSCESRSANTDFDLLTHQKIVRDYLNLYTPYRGLLLYHGLGSGKTCTSIAIAEGMKSNKRVFVMTPASLKVNFFSEMKKCGDHLYKKNQFWEFVSIDGKPEYEGILSRALSLSTDYIRKRRGAWLVNVNNAPNYGELSTEEQVQVDEQLNEMIRSKYTDINYNGLNMRRLQTLTGDFTRNPFDNAVVVIDEAHNFVSRVVNKIREPQSISFKLYDYLMNATNAKIVLLTGTPIINYPNEIGVLFNILRGYIKTWSIPVTLSKAGDKLNTDTILEILDEANFKTYDYVNYADNKVEITRNPYGFINTKKRGRVAQQKPRVPKTKKVTDQLGGTVPKNNKTKKIQRSLFGEIAEKLSFEEQPIEEDARVDKLDRRDQELYKGGNSKEMTGGTKDVFQRYNGVQLDETGNMSDDAFISAVVNILKNPKHGLLVRDAGIEVTKYKALPDTADSFISAFVDVETGDSKNINVFQRRILGLTSYFRSAQEQLLPRYVKTESGDIYFVEKTEMSLHQFGEYVVIRKEEADREKTAKKQRRKQTEDELFTISSTYRIFSRACCNFAFPPTIQRPMPTSRSGKEIDENAFDAVPEPDPAVTHEPIDEESMAESAPPEETYVTRIQKAMEDLSKKVDGTNESEFLSKEALQMYSPKFAKILENLTDPVNEGLHLLYSHFRTIEGIGILRLILLANGFAEFKLQRIGEQWSLVEKEEDAGKPRFVLYTGTETPEEKEIIRNVYNGTWDYVPSTIVTRLREIAENNIYGEIIKVFMITSSGAEGINLRNTRYVHIVEPYWHMVRVEQVVGRARRICSHQDLPEELRTVKVFLYVSTMSEQQKTDEKNIELRIRDVSKIDKKTPITTDESLYEIASIKQRINNQILRAVKETAVDCNIYSVVASKGDEPLVCYGFGKVESNQFSSYPSFETDQGAKEGLDVKTITWRGRTVKIGGVDYAMNEATNEIYDLESYNRAIRLGTDPILVGRLVKEGGRYRMEKI